MFCKRSRGLVENFFFFNNEPRKSTRSERLYQPSQSGTSTGRNHFGFSCIPFPSANTIAGTELIHSFKIIEHFNYFEDRKSPVVQTEKSLMLMPPPAASPVSSSQRGARFVPSPRRPVSLRAFAPQTHRRAVCVSPRVREPSALRTGTSKHELAGCRTTKRCPNLRSSARVSAHLV